MKKVIGVFAVIVFVLINNTVFSQENSEKTLVEPQFSAEEQFAREEAQRDQERAALEVERANSQLEELRLKSEGIIAEDAALAQTQTDAMRQELASELSKLLEEADKEAAAREKEKKEEEARNLRESFEAIEQTTQELDKDLQRIKLRPPRP